MKSFIELKKNAAKSFEGLPKIKLAVLGDSATQFLVKAIKGYGYEIKVNIEIFEAEYNQADAEIFNTDSELYKFEPQYILLFYNINSIYKKFLKTNFEDANCFSNNFIDHIKQQLVVINRQVNSKILYTNFFETTDSVFGNYGHKLSHSWSSQLRKINAGIQDLAVSEKNFYINDILSLQNQKGLDFFIDPKLYIAADVFLSIEGHTFVAKNIIDIIAATEGQQRKCIILDLDNTLWGGIIGDDGLDNIQLGDLGIGKAFTLFQLWIKALKNRGIILAVCSKNNEEIAKEVFEKHPDMVLKLDDIAIFIANWNSKAENIKNIQSILNIGFDSMVFLDDNPAERAIVKENIPQIIVPDLPLDPALYVSYLSTLNLFETASYSEIDSHRTKSYQDQVKRNSGMEYFADEKEFLETLQMKSKVESFNNFNIPRVAQLTQRSNQFNLRTIRYTDFEIEKIANNDEYFTFTFTLDDKFGENGLISVIILKKESTTTAFIDTWIMSCRVLKRGVENFVLNHMVNFARQNGIALLAGQYIPTAKNMMVQNHFKNLGFNETHINGFWELKVDQYKLQETKIKEVK